MSSTWALNEKNGKQWYVGNGIAWTEETDPACVIIPANQIEGLSDKTIGRMVREAIFSARACSMSEWAHGILTGYEGRYTDRQLVELRDQFLPFAGASKDIDRLLASIAEAEYRLIHRQPRPKAPHQEPSRPNRAGYIYLVEGLNCYKIGKSKDLPSRIRSFGLQLPFRTKLIHSITASDMVWAETYLHQTFAHCRLNGEWFDLTPDEVAWICDLQALEPE